MGKLSPGERRTCAFSFLLLFLLMASYYVMRPFRDALASDWSDVEVSALWTLNFFFSLGFVACYGWLVATMRLKTLVPSVYLFFALSFLLFYLGLTEGWLKKAFYVWVSVFSLFHLSVFWSFMADIYSEEQAKRLFSIIGAGASAGALIGPAIPTFFAPKVGVDHLLLLSICLLFFSAIISMMLRTRDGDKQIGGSSLEGFREFMTNRYLMAIGVFIVLYTMIGSIIYFEQKNILATFSIVQRTQILGGVDWIVNLLSFTIAFFVTPRLVRSLGMPTALALIPIVMSFGLLGLAAIPAAIVVLGLQIVRRAGNYAITRPSREMLFTHVGREVRFKAKPVIDVIFYRGGDMVTSWGFAALTQGFGYHLSAMAFIGAVLAAIWGSFGLYLGRWFQKN